ncbi:MAG TPA: HAD-IIIA family hydrolase, partial [Longimicrobiales bacterium]|nr:HAD-IIIA family hydrolase [Longimicrobiales bacterium]
RVELIPNTAGALRRLRDAGFALVIVTNQSGIARGLYREEDFRAVQSRLEAVLRDQDVWFDGVYFCPHHPDYTGPCDCRKPGPGLYLRAAFELGLDLRRSAYVGDRVKDVEPAGRFGGLGILVQTGYGSTEAARAPAGVVVVRDLAAAAQILIDWHPRRRPAPDTEVQ